MKNPADFTKDGAQIHCFLACPFLGISGAIKLLIDTGSALTLLLSEKDATTLGIDYSGLERAAKSVIGVGGATETYVIKNVVLIMRDPKKNISESEIGIDEVLVEKVREKNPTLRRALQNRASLLGWVFLEKYGHILYADWKNKNVYLEK